MHITQCFTLRNGASDKPGAIHLIPPPRSDTLIPTPTSSADFRRVQRLLQSLGYDPGPIDGVVGARTSNAIIAFQSDIGVDPTGEIDEVLMAQLTLTSRLAGERGKNLAPTASIPSYTGSRPTLSVAMPPFQIGGTEQRLTASEVYENRKRSVFVVLAAQSVTALNNRNNVLQGSAVAISPNLLLTNCHVLKRAPIIVIVSGDQVLPVRLAAENSVMDC